MSVEPNRLAKRRRWLLFAGVLVAGAAAWLAYLWFAPSPVVAVEGELDRADPGWRWADLETRRVDLPDTENAALVLLDAAARLPHGWPMPPAGNAPDGADVTDILTEVANLPPPMLPNRNMTDELRNAMEQAKDALAKAGTLMNYRHGCFPLQINPANPLAGSHDYGAEARLVASLLQADVAWRLVQQDFEGAFAECCNLLAAVRAIGDEGTMIHQLARLAIAGSAVRSVERLLAQGQFAEPALAPLQKLLAEARPQGSLVNALRWERAYQHEMLNAMSANRPTGGPPPALWDQVREAFSRDSLRHQLSKRSLRKNHARILEYATTLIEWLKAPTADQERRLEEFAREAHTLSIESDADAMLFVQTVITWEKFVERSMRNDAVIASTEAAVAAERYRLKHGHWPETLEQLVPDFLAVVPGDPYLQGHPLRVKRVPNGLVIYSIGPDRQDDGGNLLRVGPPWRGKDIGVQLWDPDHRRQTPTE